MMELHDCLRSIINEYGPEIIREKRLVSILDDLHVFDQYQYPFLKKMFRDVIEKGFGARLLECGSWNIQADILLSQCSNSTGYQVNFLSMLFHSLAYGLGWIEDVSVIDDNIIPKEDLQIKEMSPQDLFDQAVNYDSGSDGVQKDQVKAFDLFSKAAELGNPYAERWLGKYFEKGLGGVAIDLSKAVEHYKNAAAKGDPEAQYLLGYCYENGQGVKKHFQSAKKWYRMAADNGSVDGQKAFTKLVERSQQRRQPNSKSNQIKQPNVNPYDSIRVTEKKAKRELNVKGKVCSTISLLCVPLIFFGGLYIFACYCFLMVESPSWIYYVVDFNIFVYLIIESLLLTVHILFKDGSTPSMGFFPCLSKCFICEILLLVICAIPVSYVIRYFVR